MTTARVSTVAVDVLHAGSSGARVRIPAIFAEVLSVSVAPAARVSSLSVEVLHTGAVASRVQVSALFLDTLFTTGAPNDSINRCWGFKLDGHVCYCIDLGTNGTLIFDETTSQWYHYETNGYGGHWNMKNGFQWITGKKIIAGDLTLPKAYYLDPSSFLDEGWRPIVCEIRGVLFSASNDYTSQYSLRLIGAAGRNTDTESPVVYLEFSDDEGATWTSAGSITLTTDKKQRVEWTSLGAFAAPGRMFRIYSDGGAKYIGYVVADTD